MISATNNPSSKASPDACPVGISDCPVAAEVGTLKQEVNRLSGLTSTDTLTGLANYRYFLQALAQEMERTMRSGQPTTLIMLDIDHFKKINDSWGHETGNMALKHIAGLIARTVRRLDIPCRYGGEEFTVTLPNTGLQTGIRVGERIRRTIAGSPLIHTQQTLPITASLGIATYRPDPKITPEDLIAQADQFLYQAKQEGRNRICHPQPEPSTLVSSEERRELSALFGRQSRKKDPS